LDGQGGTEGVWAYLQSIISQNVLTSNFPSGAHKAPVLIFVPEQVKAFGQWAHSNPSSG